MKFTTPKMPLSSLVALAIVGLIVLSGCAKKNGDDSGSSSPCPAATKAALWLADAVDANGCPTSGSGLSASLTSAGTWLSTDSTLACNSLRAILCIGH